MSISWLAATSTDMSGLREMSMSRYMVDKATGPENKEGRQILDCAEAGGPCTGHHNVAQMATSYRCSLWPPNAHTTQGQDLKKRHTPSRAIWFWVLARHHQAWADLVWRWRCSVGLSASPRLDRVRNEDVRRRIGVSPIVEKMCEAWLRWQWPHHQKRWWYSGENSIQLSPPGQRPRGLSKKRWLDRLAEEMHIVNINILHLFYQNLFKQEYCDIYNLK